jgi:hypothetical protein
MACFGPYDAYRSREGRNKATGKWPVVFNPKDGYRDQWIPIPCGKCIGCTIKKARSWAVRCSHESLLHNDNYFITLTYNDDALPAGRSLVKKDFQEFMYRVRYYYGEGVRYFYCGEYGSKFGRPHFHACMFNFPLYDLRPAPTRKSGNLMTSKYLEETLWQGQGFVSVAPFSYSTARYVSHYVTKKYVKDGTQKLDYGDRLPEYGDMSRRPGIGRGYYDLYKKEIYRDDILVVDGKEVGKPPRYYDSLYEKEFPKEFKSVKRSRRRFAVENADDATWERLRVREKVMLLNLEDRIGDNQ